MKYLSCLFKETRRKNIGMKKVFFSPWQVKNLRTEECQIDRSSYDLCVSSTWNLVAKNNVWEREKKREKKKNVSSLQKASIGMLISCRNVEAAVLISPPIRWPIELDDRGRPLIGKLMTFRRQRINPYESRSSRFSVRSSSAWRPSPPTLSGDNLLISKQASVNFWYSCGSCVFKSSNVDFDGFFFFHSSLSVNIDPCQSMRNRIPVGLFLLCFVFSGIHFRAIYWLI